MLVLLLLLVATPVFADGPITIMPPSGQPIFVHPTPSGATILPPVGAPIFVYPTPSGLTVLPPVGLPTFVYPPVSK